MGLVDDVIWLCCKLFPHENIKAALLGSLRAGGTVGSCATVGGLVLGPVGLLVGKLRLRENTSAPLTRLNIFTLITFEMRATLGLINIISFLILHV